MACLSPSVTSIVRKSDSYCNTSVIFACDNFFESGRKALRTERGQKKEIGGKKMAILKAIINKFSVQNRVRRLRADQRAGGQYLSLGFNRARFQSNGPRAAGLFAAA